MKDFILKTILFSFLALSTYIPTSLYVLPKLIEKVVGPSTEQQINKSFNNAKDRNYELLILGNSGTYRGINPNMFEISTYNFSHDNDSYNQIYYKLQWLEQKQFKYLILGVDYFQFSFFDDSRNYIYNSFFGDSYKADFSQMNAGNLFFNKTNILEANRLKYLRSIFKTKTTSIFQRDNGQYIKHGIAKPDDENYYSIERLPFQEKYFNLILDYCTKEEIEVFLCMLPTRKNALKNYKKDDIEDFNDFINSFTSNSVHFLNYSNQKGWSIADYTDITHLNERAANKFSKQLNDTIKYTIAQK